MAAYADVDDLEAFLDQSAPDVPSEAAATRMLLRASELLDDYLRTAVYATDALGMPTDSDDIAALKDAACAQVEFWFAGDEEDDVLGPLVDLTIGTVKATPQAPLVLAPRAGRILRAAGLYRGEPVSL
jgi:hypothetical protein